MAVVKRFVLAALVILLALGMAMQGPDAEAQGCADDGFEENDSINAATPVAFDDTVQAQICANDADFFGPINYETGDLIAMTAFFTRLDGDIELELFGPQGSVRIGNVTPNNDGEQIVYPVVTSGDYRIKVSGIGQAENSYVLELAKFDLCELFSDTAAADGLRVANTVDLDLAIHCFNEQTPVGDLQLTVIDDIFYDTGQVVAAIDEGGGATLTIDGAGHTLSGPGGIVDGENLITIVGGSNVVIKRLVITDAAAAAIHLDASPIGTVRIEDSDIVNPGFHGLSIAGGNATVENSHIRGPVSASGGSLTIERSHIDNRFGFPGPVIDQSGATVTVTNSTISGDDFDSGLSAAGPGSATITNSTIAAVGTGVSANPNGSTTLVSNVIDGVCTGTFSATSTANFATDGSCGNSTALTNALGDLAAAGCAVVAPIDCVPVYELLPSLAVDGGECTGLTTDQRGAGFDRFIGGACDAGAYEVPPCSISQAECAALVALFTSTGGPAWTNNTGWNTSSDPCTWFGVTCEGGTVTRLTLDENNLTGSLPTAIGDLVGLTHLHLHKNNLGGSLPSQIGLLLDLEVLLIHKNALSGPIPPETGDLVSVKTLFLQSNQFSGAIPTALGDLTNLEYLRLDRNSFTGGIPTELGDLPNLERLYLQRAGLSGQIPPDLGDLPKLSFLYLQVNDLDGSIPTELGQLPALERLHLYKNELTGTIPTALADIATLRRLYISDNNFDGSIPAELGQFPALNVLYLFGNDLTGPIPPEIGDIATLTHLYLFNNDLEGQLPPELGNLANLERLYVHKNDLSGLLPPELGNLANLKRAFLQFNNFTGPLPPELGQLDTITHLRLDKNALTGALPPELIDITDTATTFKVSDGGGFNNCITATPPLSTWLDANDPNWAHCQ